MKQGLIILKAKAFDLHRTREAVERELRAVLAQIAAAEKEPDQCESKPPLPPQS